MSPDIRIGAAYIRVSTEEQAEYSPDAQLRLIRDYAASHGIIVPEQYIFVDEGISGRGTKKRDAFNRMIGTAKTKPKPFDVILLWKFSRFARSRQDSVVYKSMLRKQLGIEVVSISEPTGDDKMSVIVEALIEAMDEYYSINLGEEVKRGMTEAHMRGKLQSVPSFGYRAEEGALAVVPEEAALVREAFSRFVAGEGCFAIARSLNERGVRTHRGNRFENRTVEYILRNPVYIGKLRWNPTGRSRRNFDDPGIVVVDGQHEAIIDSDTWEAAQRRMAALKAKWKYHGRPVQSMAHWLSGVVSCSNCGGHLNLSQAGYFQCGNYSRGSCRVSHAVMRDALVEALLDRMEQDAVGSAPLSYALTHVSAAKDDPEASLTAALERNKKKSARLREAYLNGADTVEEYKEMKRRLEEEAAEILSDLKKAKRKAPEKDPLPVLRASLARTVKILRSPQKTKEEKHEAVTGVLSSCTYTRSTNTLSVVYRVSV